MNLNDSTAMRYHWCAITLVRSQVRALDRPVMSPAALSVGRSTNAYCVRVQGRCTMSQSPALHQFAIHVFAEGPEVIYVDLRNCDHLDSTFLGSLLDLHRKFGRAPELRLKLIVGEDVRM